MSNFARAGLAFVVLGALCPLLAAQNAPAPPSSPPAPTPPPAVIAPTKPPVTVPANLPPVAATVNGVPITEIAVQRGLKRIPPQRQDEARPEIVNFLIDNALIDQYLAQLKIPLDEKDVDAKLKEVKDEIQKNGSTIEKVLKELSLTEAELRAQIAAQLRWDRFINDQANDKVLRDLFDNNRDIFDGTMVRARHILLTPPEGDTAAVEQARVKLAGMKKQIEDTVTQDLAKQPPTTDSLMREKVRTKVMDDTFAALASKESMCPSKSQGGDLGFFPRAGSMVEPFARAAFSMKAYQMSDVVSTQFGQHLILVTERKPGKEVKFEDLKEEVKEVFGDRMRESLIARLRPAAKIIVAGGVAPK